MLGKLINHSEKAIYPKRIYFYFDLVSGVLVLPGKLAILMLAT